MPALINADVSQLREESLSQSMKNVNTHSSTITSNTGTFIYIFIFFNMSHNMINKALTTHYNRPTELRWKPDLLNHTVKEMQDHIVPLCNSLWSYEAEVIFGCCTICWHLTQQPPPPQVRARQSQDTWLQESPPALSLTPSIDFPSYRSVSLNHFIQGDPLPLPPDSHHWTGWFVPHWQASTQLWLLST